MKFFNVGALELVFILLLAFIVLGPEKAIKAAGDVARWIKGLTNSQFWKDLVSTSREIQDIPKKLMEEAEIQNTIADLDRSFGEAKSALAETQKSIDSNANLQEEEIPEEDLINPENFEGE